jgi:hypothetical protein
MPDPSREPIPAAQTVRNLVYHLAQILRVSGPWTPPGFETALLSGADWARDINLTIQYEAVFAEDIAASVLEDGMLRMWPLAVRTALLIVRDILGSLLEEAGLTRYADQPPYPGCLGARKGDPPRDFPLMLADDDHARLLWAYRTLDSALDGLTEAAESGDAPDPSANGEAKPGEPDPLRALADTLWEQGANTRAALLELMAGRDSATFEEIALHVHGDPQASDRAIRQNVMRANKDLAASGSPVVLRAVGAKIFKVPKPR